MTFQSSRRKVMGSTPVGELGKSFFRVFHLRALLHSFLKKFINSKISTKKSYGHNSKNKNSTVYFDPMCGDYRCTKEINIKFTSPFILK